ncbi:MAG: chromosomal replication initiator protein DnaA [Chitinophagales bacterium]
MSKVHVEKVWHDCLLIIKEHVNQQSFRTWFEPIRPVRIENKVLTIQVPSQFFYEWLEEHYVALLRRTITEKLGEGARLEYQIVVDNGGTGIQNNPHTHTINLPATPPSKVGKKDASKYRRNNPKGNPIKNPFIIPGIKNVNIESQLNPKYTFENYIEGECNQLARSAGIAVASKPGKTSFNPLVLYGGVGLGKTHLAQAIGNYVKDHFQDKMILYVSSEKFTNQFIDAVKNGSINDFMNFYQLIDVLIVDDIQFFANKDRTQDIFFHTFNHLHQSGKQIILTSDRPPKDLEGMEERLLSRFKWGLTADLQVPDLETRIAIIEKKLHNDGIEIPRNIVEYLAYHINTNVRELEGALISLMAQSSLSRKEIDLSLAKGIVKHFVNNMSKEISIEVIQKVVSEYFKIPVELLKGKTRKRAIVQARQVSMYLAKQFTESSFKVIGQHFGGRDHSTVIHGCQAVSNLMETDRFFQEDVLKLQKQLNLNT